MTKIVNTASVPVRNRLSLWTETVSDTFVRLQCTADGGRESIDGELWVESLASLEIARVRASAQTVSRRKPDIAASSTDYFLVGVQTQGSCIVTQDGRSASIENGGFALYDTTRPYSLQLTDGFEQLVLRLPRNTLERHLPEASQLTALKVNAVPGTGSLLVSTVKSLVSDMGFLTPDAALSVAQGVEHLIVAGLLSLSKAVPDRDRFARRKLIQSHIFENLRDESLSIASISEQLHLSPSSIHRAFAADGQTVMGWVWQQRLEHIRQELLGGHHDGTLTELSASWGFSDSAHFSRAFRRRYGYPPSRLRRATPDVEPHAEYGPESRN
jgi:AraC-like DNA-binding protein